MKFVYAIIQNASNKLQAQTSLILFKVTVHLIWLPIATTSRVTWLDIPQCEDGSWAWLNMTLKNLTHQLFMNISAWVTPDSISGC